MKLTPKQKPYVIGGALALIAFLILRKKDPEAEEATALSTETENAGTPSYLPSQFYAFANRLEQAMFDIGTDEDAIFAVFNSLNNNADFLALKTAFGVRNYTGGFVPGFLSDNLTLDGWISQELNSGEIQEINDSLANKGITYRF
jgi:hypothetical protein